MDCDSRILEEIIDTLKATQKIIKEYQSHSFFLADRDKKLRYNRMIMKDGQCVIYDDDGVTPCLKVIPIKDSQGVNTAYNRIVPFDYKEGGE